MAQATKTPTTSEFKLQVRSLHRGGVTRDIVTLPTFEDANREVNWYAGIDESVGADASDQRRMQTVGEAWHFLDRVRNREYIVTHVQKPLKAYVESVAVKVETDGSSEDPEAVGVFATARIKFATPQGGWTQGAEVRTPGLWDIQQPSGDYLRDVGQEELGELDDMLGALGISHSEGPEIDWSEVTNGY